MKLIIRADASTAIGTGHVMRSSTLAAEFITRGHEVLYVGDIQLIDLITQRFKEIGLSQKPLETKEFAYDTSSDILLIDSYSLDPNDQFLQNERWALVVAIVDPVTPNYICDIKIAPSLNPSFSYNPGELILTGPEYLLLRNTLKKIKKRSLSIHSPLKIFLAGGGSDPSNFCSAIANELLDLDDDFILHVFSDNLEFKRFKDSRLRLHSVGNKMDHIANQCDLGITLASTLSIELIAREMPIGVGVAFENQRQGYDQLVKQNFAVPVGEFHTEYGWDISREKITQLVRSSEIRARLVGNIKGLIDLNGPKRIVDKVFEYLSD